MARDRTYNPEPAARKYTVTQEEIDAIREDGKNAKALLDNPYLKEYCNNIKKSILELHAKQAVYDRTETTETNGVKDTIIIPSKKEYTLLAGEYRFIDKLISNLEQTVKIAKDMEEKLKTEELEVKDE